VTLHRGQQKTPNLRLTDLHELEKVRLPLQEKGPLRTAGNCYLSAAMQ